MDDRTDERTNEGWTDGRSDERTDGRTKERKNGQSNGRMDDRRTAREMSPTFNDDLSRLRVNRRPLLVVRRSSIFTSIDDEYKPEEMEKSEWMRKSKLISLRESVAEARSESKVARVAMCDSQCVGSDSAASCAASPRLITCR